MKEIMLNLDQKKARLSTAVKWGLGLAAAVIISPVIFLAIKGMVGLGIAVVFGMAMINYAPVLSMKFANWKLKSIKQEAAKNPIETMQHVFKEKEIALVAFLERIEDFATEVAGFGDKLTGFKAQFPKDSAKFEGIYNNMEALLKRRRAKYKESKAKLAEFNDEINKADAIWKMGLAAQAMTRAAGMTEDDFMQKIKTETAIDSVHSSLNRAMAELETSLMEETPAITHQPAQVIDITPIDATQHVYAEVTRKAAP